MPWSLLPLIPLGLLTGVLSGLLGIGGGLVFAPILLWIGLDPHVALATSTLAIVPTAMGGSWAHLRSHSIPWRDGASIATGAVIGASLFSHLGANLAGWQLLGLQSLLYGGLCLTFSQTRGASPAAGRPAIDPAASLVRRWLPLEPLAWPPVWRGGSSGLVAG